MQLVKNQNIINRAGIRHSNTCIVFESDPCLQIINPQYIYYYNVNRLTCFNTYESQVRCLNIYKDHTVSYSIKIKIK